MKEFGIDISRWQGDFDFQKAVAEGVKFAVIKGGGGDDGLYVDSKFSCNYTNAKKHNIPVGVYWFSRALTTQQAKEEADYLYEHILRGKQFELPIYIDVENKTQLGVGKRLLTDIIKTWCDRLEKKGLWVGIYSSQSYFDQYMFDAELTKYAHWVACWAPSCSYPNKECFGMWQFGGETNYIRSNRIAGQVCDQDYMLFDYPTAIKNAGLNGFNKQTVTAKKNLPKPYSVKVTVDVLNIRKGAGTQYPVVGCIKDRGVYTIIDTCNKWGFLKSKAGWICLDYAKKI